MATRGRFQALSLTSLDYIKRPEVVRALEALVWDLVVFDEAHALAGRSDRAIAASMLDATRANGRPSDGHAAFR